MVSLLMITKEYQNSIRTSRSRTHRANLVIANRGDSGYVAGSGIYTNGRVLSSTTAVNDTVITHFLPDSSNAPNRLHDYFPTFESRETGKSLQSTFNCSSSASYEYPMNCSIVRNDLETTVYNGNVMCRAKVTYKLPAREYFVVAAQNAKMQFPATPSSLYVQHCALIICSEGSSQPRSSF